MTEQKNYIITLFVQYTTDSEALAKTAAIAKAANEMAYLKNGPRDLGFFTAKGDYGTPKPQKDQ